MEMAVDEARIAKVVGDLVADYDRRDGYLTKADVERLAVKRQLSIEESAEVNRQLDALGISLEDELHSVESDRIPDIDIVDKVDDEAETIAKRLDVRLQKLNAKLLTANEEVELGRRMELGRRAQSELEAGVFHSEEHDRVIYRAAHAKEAMIVANLRLVLHIARPYAGYSDLSLDDLFQEGTVGLMRATDKFDHTLGYKFSTYATWWIRQSIARALADRGTTIRLPVHVHDDVLRFKRAMKLLTQTHPERRMNIAMLADELAWPIEKIHFIQQVAALVPASLDEKINGYDDLTLVDTLASHLPTPEDEIGQIKRVQCIDRALNSLDARQKTVLQLRFGLGDSINDLTLEEIGQIFDLTRERIRQIESKALDKLRHPTRAAALRDFLDS